MADISNDRLKNTLGMAVSVIATEHFLSAGLSSPWSTAKFAISDEDKQEVWHYFNEAATSSAIFGVITSYMLRSWFPIISSSITLLYYKKLYTDALARTPSQNPTEVLVGITPQLPVNSEKYEPLTTIQLDQLKKFLDSTII